MLFFHFLLNRNFPKLKYFIIPILLISLHYLFNFHYYGEFLPDSSSAKVLHGNSGYWSGGLSFVPFFYTIIDDYGLSFLMLPFAAYALIKVNNMLDKLILLYLFLLSLFYIILKIPHYQWYYAPYVLSYIYFSLYGLLHLSVLLMNKQFKSKFVSLLVGFIFLLYLIPVYKDFKSENIHVYEEVGIWLNERYEHDTKIAMVEIGFVGFYSDIYIIDILGLVNHKNAKFVAERNMTAWFDLYEADLILVHDPLWDIEEDTFDEAILRGYVVEENFQFSGLKLLSYNK